MEQQIGSKGSAITRRISKSTKPLSIQALIGLCFAVLLLFLSLLIIINSLLKTPAIVSQSEDMVSGHITDIKIQAGHAISGTRYGAEAVKAYAKHLHGPDGAVLLDPYFMPFLESVKNKVLLDAGCGSGVWAHLAAQMGAKKVFACDIQPEFIDECSALLADSELHEKLQFIVADVSELPYADGTVDSALSLLVGCNLPDTSFAQHISELARVTKNMGEALVVAPNSLDVVFTDGSKADSDAIEDIGRVIKSMPRYPSPQQISDALLPLRHVYSATFALDNLGRLFLVDDISKLHKGQAIWRKLPSVVIPNYFHDKSEYITEFRKNGFEIAEITEPTFDSTDTLEAFNESSETSLGSSYVFNAPFVLFQVTKES